MIAVTLLVTLALGFALGHECLQDWIYHEGSCYSFGKTAVTWADAQTICQLSGANLAKIETEGEHNFLANLSRNHNTATYIWLGASDIFYEGHWIWSNGHETFSNYTNWGPEEPNDTENDEDCLSLNRDKAYKWNDMRCNRDANFICEGKPYF
jgi:hypothetical protein